MGLFYKSIAACLGFKVNQQEGKVTGLAAYGDPTRFAERLRPFLYAESRDDCLRIVSRAAERHISRLSRRKVSFLRLLSYAPLAFSAREWESLLNELLRREFCQFYSDVFAIDGEVIPFPVAADIAAAAQQVFEDAALAVVRHYQGRFAASNVALAGGVFANVRLNQRILDLPGVENVYIHPGMGDEGLAFGAAILHADIQERGKSYSGFDHVFAGPTYENGAFRSALEVRGIPYTPADDDALIEQAVEALKAGRVVGLFRGASEYGPRALGHRSILANPADPELPARLNRRLRRAAFMPFAPTVLAECFDTLFVSPKRTGAYPAARFMTIALDVAPEWHVRIPAVVHVDGTARPQVLSEEDDHFFYHLVRGFHEATGLGCVLNTSMNLHGEPLVNSPADALNVLDKGAVDMLILGSYVVTAPVASSPL